MARAWFRTAKEKIRAPARLAITNSQSRNFVPKVFVVSIKKRAASPRECKIQKNVAKLPKFMRWTHLIFGIALFIVFVTTGKYMRVDFPDKDIIPQDLRLLMRSRHIYILFSALIHLALGVYMQIRPQAWQKALQYAGSLILTISSGLLIWAFIVETYQLQHFSNISRYGIYLSLAGVGFHLFGGIGQNRER